MLFLLRLVRPPPPSAFLFAYFEVGPYSSQIPLGCGIEVPGLSDIILHGLFESRRHPDADILRFKVVFRHVNII